MSQKKSLQKNGGKKKRHNLTLSSLLTPRTEVRAIEEIVMDGEMMSALGISVSADEVSLPTGDVSMSVVIMKFVEPFLLQLKDEAYRRVFLRMAVTAWNGSLLPKDKRDETKFADKNGKPYELIKELFEAMVVSKSEEFADNKWAIMEYEIIGEGPLARIKVSQTMLFPRLNS